MTSDLPLPPLPHTPEAADATAAEPGDDQGFDRRRFLELMGASFAFGGGLGAGCARQPDEQIVPYVVQPEEIVPGKPLFYATAMPFDGYARGLLVESHMGRPTKAEGNPLHPASRGATHVFDQASLLTLYDPDRSRVVTRKGEISTWVAFVDAVGRAVESRRGQQGAGIRILTEAVTSPTLAAQIRSLQARMPGLRWHAYQTVNQDHERAGARLAFGQDVDTLYRFDRASVIVSLDANFLSDGPGAIRAQRDFAERRRVRSTPASMSRLYVAEPMPTLTGAMADHRLPLRARQVEGLARRLWRTVTGSPQESTESGGPPGDNGGARDWIAAAATDLRQHRGAGIVVPGRFQPPAVHALAHAMNLYLGNVGHTMVFVPPADAAATVHEESLRELTADMAAGRVDLLIIIGGNPVYTAPVDLRFSERMGRVRTAIHLSLYDDETSQACEWHLPQSHYLESWSDARAFDGTASIIQPLIAALYHGRTAHQVVAALAGEATRSSHDIVRAHWQARRSELSRDDFERFWRRALHDGVIPGTEAQPASVVLRSEAIPEAVAVAAAASQAKEDIAALEIVFRPDPTVWDGSLANNGWLQELPKPITHVTWENVAHLSPATAARLGIASQDVVEARYRGRAVQAPAWIVPGHADGSVTVHLGHGRTRAGVVGTGVGFNAGALRTSDSPWMGAGLTLRKTGERFTIACAQPHHAIEGRNLLRSASLAHFRANPAFAQQAGHTPPRKLSLYPEMKHEGNAWGMVIDLGTCTGCSACVIACQAENNVPVVGKAEVTRGREMHWLRIDSYASGPVNAPTIAFQPVLCMHCENAPCEVVCPVAATSHSSDGLNQMTYNRCIGTRYCANNCPYKVRRFNFLSYTGDSGPARRLLANPDVTVRSRGVMEKCSYCVQRISAARIQAQRERRPLRDGDVVTACEAVCPSQAIVFGDINDPGSRVARLKATPLDYGMLAELNTRPRTSYLAKVTNPHPDYEGV